MPSVCITEKCHAYVISHTLCINLCVFIREVFSSTFGQDTDNETNYFWVYSGLPKGCWNNALNYFKPTTYHTQGTVVAQWLRCCVTNRKVAGSITAGVIGIFH